MVISHEFIIKVKKKIRHYIESDEVKLMPVLQAKTFNWTVPFATAPDATVEIEEKIKNRKWKVKH